MNLPIQDWKNEKKFSSKVNNLLEESITCYKHGAYRASLLFSYLAFITFIKETIIKSHKPSGIPQSRWDNILQDLQNDDKWEKRVFEELTNSSNPIFNVREDIRQQVKYWKDRRNDCAHFKENYIEAEHTEIFWSFLRSNISRITIEGGLQSLINKFKDFFDVSKTPPNTDITPLILEIENAVDTTELNDFFNAIGTMTDPVGYGDPALLSLLNKIFETCGDQVKEKLIDFLFEKDLDIDFTAHSPNKIGLIYKDERNIRELWRKRIFRGGHESNLFVVFCALLRSGLIPEDQLSEAFNHLFAAYNQTRYNFPKSSTMLDVLKNDIFRDIIYAKAIDEDKLKTFMWVNAKSGIIAFYFEEFPLRVETVQRLCEMVQRERHSWWLREDITRILQNNPNKRAEFEAIAQSNDIEIPSAFTIT